MTFLAFLLTWTVLGLLFGGALGSVAHNDHEEVDAAARKSLEDMWKCEVPRSKLSK